MSDRSNIEWTDATWNPTTGCTKVSPGCDHCYAEALAERFRGTPGHYYEHGFDVQLRPDKLDMPLRWKRPRRIFVNSMSDLFHEAIPDDYIATVFAVMAEARQHTFQLLTKRHGRLRSLVGRSDFRGKVADASAGIPDWPNVRRLYDDPWDWPLPNVWLGVSVEDQQWADNRIPALVHTPAAVRFLSCEPLLGPIDLGLWAHLIDWVIVGGESGRGARPMHPDWARSLRQQCTAAGVAFHFKQWGEWQLGSSAPGNRDQDHVVVRDGRHEPWTGHTRPDGGPATELAHARYRRDPGTEAATVMSRVGKKTAGRELDGRTWDEYPEVAS